MKGSSRAAWMPSFRAFLTSLPPGFLQPLHRGYPRGQGSRPRGARTPPESNAPPGIRSEAAEEWENPQASVLLRLLPPERTRSSRQASETRSLNQKPNAGKSWTSSPEGPLCRRRGFSLQFGWLFTQRSGLVSFCLAMQHFSFLLRYQFVENPIRILHGNSACGNNLWDSPATACSLHDISLTLKLQLFIYQLHMKAQRGCQSRDVQR